MTSKKAVRKRSNRSSRWELMDSHLLCVTPSNQIRYRKQTEVFYFVSKSLVFAHSFVKGWSFFTFSLLFSRFQKKGPLLGWSSTHLWSFPNLTCLLTTISSLFHFQSSIFILFRSSTTVLKFFLGRHALQCLPCVSGITLTNSPRWYLFRRRCSVYPGWTLLRAAWRHGSILGAEVCVCEGR